jgi:putative DNA primase/helicase
MATQISKVDLTLSRAENSGISKQPDDQNDLVYPPTFADDDLALRFTSEHGDNLRYTAHWGHWHVWVGTRWKRDETCYVVDLVRLLCRKVSSECYEDKNLPRRIASASTVAAVERLARSDRRHTASVHQWDADPWLLNTPAGVVDLRTGTLRPAMREDFCTKVTSAAPGGDCPLWMAFLSRITADNIELQKFLQRFCGYLLTGITREDALFFFYGTGANGKTVFINTISEVMGDYSKTAPMEAFTASNNDQHPTDLAGLQGARLVSASETEDGKRWAENKLKRLTGGDPIAARFMRQDFFEYVPQFKLLIAGNHKPGLHAVNEAIRRRIYLVPFSVTIPVEERDEELTEKLRPEFPGILRWMIDGCLDWQRDGLSQPSIVKDATEEYLASEDVVGQWLEECCDIGPHKSSTGTALFASFQQWCIRNEEMVSSQKRFSQNLEARGFNRKRSSNTRSFCGIALRLGDRVRNFGL